jgi:uncharacterized repeat protein (TIGR03806 family)
MMLLQTCPLPAAATFLRYAGEGFHSAALSYFSFPCEAGEGARKAEGGALRRLARRAIALVAILAATACSRAPQAVHFFAEGRPQQLSDWNVLLKEGQTLRLNERVVPYDLNTPLFTDYAHKLRTVWMPQGSAAKYSEDATFDFPVGTIFTKTFYYPLPDAANGGGPAVARTYDTALDFAGTSLDLRHVRLIETRILVRRENGWDALPYVWNTEQSDAELARTGDETALELVAADGAREPFTYVVPNENQCAGCHVTDVRSKQITPIGPKARHLNRDFAYADGSENQLARWTKLGLLSGAPAADTAPRNAHWLDAQQPVTARARAYLDINCGHCHSATGPANTTGLLLEAKVDADRHLGLCKPPVAAGRGTGDHLFDIVPGKPDDSILPFRMASHETGVMMPEQGRSTTHVEGLQLIRDWIAAWPGSCEI